MRCESGGNGLIRKRLNSCLKLQHEVVQSDIPPGLNPGNIPPLPSERVFDNTELCSNLISGQIESVDEVLIVHILEDSEALRPMSVWIKTRVQKHAVGRLTIRTDCSKASAFC